MTYMGRWFGGLTSSAFLYGAALGMWMYPPIKWGALGGDEPAEICRLHQQHPNELAKPV